MLNRSEAEFWAMTPAKVELLARLAKEYQQSEGEDQPAEPAKSDPMELFRFASMGIG